MQLYSFDLSPFAARCRLAIYKKHLPIEIVAPPDSGTRSEAYLTLNPIGKVPALVVGDGLVIPESEVIVEYLEDRFPTPALRPEGAEARARMRLLTRIGDLYLMPAMGKLFGQIDPGTRDAAVVDAGVIEIGKALDHVERWLAPDHWAVGDAWSLADCSLIPQLFVLERLMAMLRHPAVLTSRPKATGYWRRVQSDPDAAKVVAEMESGLARMMAQRQG